MVPCNLQLIINKFKKIVLILRICSASGGEDKCVKWKKGKCRSGSCKLLLLLLLLILLLLFHIGPNTHTHGTTKSIEAKQIGQMREVFRRRGSIVMCAFFFRKKKSREFCGKWHHISSIKGNGFVALRERNWAFFLQVVCIHKNEGLLLLYIKLDLFTVNPHQMNIFLNKNEVTFFNKRQPILETKHQI